MPSRPVARTGVPDKAQTAIEVRVRGTPGACVHKDKGHGREARVESLEGDAESFRAARIKARTWEKQRAIALLRSREQRAVPSGEPHIAKHDGRGGIDGEFQLLAEAAGRECPDALDRHRRRREVEPRHQSHVA